MKLSENIIDIFELLSKLGNKKINHYLELDGNTVKINLKNSTLCEITPNFILLNGKFNILDRIIINSKDNRKIEQNQFANFINEISDSIVRLNHIGIAYFCTNIENEINFYKKLLKNSKIKIY